MLNDIEYIRQGIESVLIYTRTLTEKAMNMELSFVEKDVEYKNQARDFRYAYRNLFRRAVKIANRNVIKEVLESGAIVTEYTTSMELLTEELFGIDTDKESTILINKLESGVPVPTPELITEVTSILFAMRDLNSKFKDYIREISNKLNNVTLFMFDFEINIENTLFKVDLFDNSINRLLNKEKFSPGYVAQLQSNLTEIMAGNAYLIGSYINQSEQKIIRTARIISQDFQNLLPDYYLQLSPILQSQLSKRSYDLILNFISYLKYVLGKIEERSIQFITGPLFFDSILNEVYFYKFILEGNIRQLDEEKKGVSTLNDLEN